MKATFAHGRPLMVDHTATAAIAAGDVLKIGASIRIAHSDIPNGERGALAAGGGVYDIEKATGAGIVDGGLVYWDDTAKKVTATATNNTLLGKAIGATVSADTVARVQHIG